MIEIYFFIFDYFYFHYDNPSSLVNYTNCLKICNQRDMTLPSADDANLILHQIEIFKIKRFAASNSTQNYLTYFIGK